MEHGSHVDLTIDAGSSAIESKVPPSAGLDLEPGQKKLFPGIRNALVRAFDIAGRYRNKDVFITGTDHTPPSSFDVPIKMDELIAWAQKNYKTLPVVDFAAIFHHKFVHIHPFEDGNGRTGRLLMNIFLMHYGFPMTIIQVNDRKKYYRTLALADGGNYRSLVNFVGQAVLRSLNIYLDILTPSKQKEEWMSLAEATQYCTYSQAYLGKLAKEGKIDAHKLERNWVTTKDAIIRYVKEQRS